MPAQIAQTEPVVTEGVRFVLPLHYATGPKRNGISAETARITLAEETGISAAIYPIRKPDAADIYVTKIRQRAINMK